MTGEPLVSILMVTYNSALFLDEAIKSVLSQTYENFELIVCDDNSTDKSWDIISSYEDARIKKCRNEKNLGEYANRSNAILKSSGDFLIFIDGDDILYPHGLRFMMDFVKSEPGCAMIISRPWDERILFPKRITPHQFYCFEYLDSGIAGINFTKVLFKAEPLKQAQPFPLKVKLGDLYIQYKLALKNDSLIIPDASAWWRRNRGQASERLLNDQALYLQHSLWILLEMLQDPVCPLSEEEKRMAYDNLYGPYGRFLVKQGTRLNFRSVIRLLKLYPLPFPYWKKLFINHPRNYFSGYSGNNPL